MSLGVRPLHFRGLRQRDDVGQRGELDMDGFLKSNKPWKQQSAEQKDGLDSAIEWPTNSLQRLRGKAVTVG